MRRKNANTKRGYAPNIAAGTRMSLDKRTRRVLRRVVVLITIAFLHFDKAEAVWAKEGGSLNAFDLLIR